MLANHQGLRQLSSPPFSARSLAEWMIRNLHNPERPLGSVRLLVSEARPTPFRHPTNGTTHDLLAATLENVEGAFDGWMKEGDKNPDSLMLFYFCGHGLSTGLHHALLLEDFGQNAIRPLRGAIDFNRTRVGMNQCAARHQCYFVDACRTTATMTQYSQDYAGEVLAQPNAAASKERPVLYSTLEGEEAYGRPNQPSHFAEALLAGFNGAGGDRTQGDWRISTSSLARAVEAHLRRKASRGASLQIAPSVDLTTFDLHRLAGKPMVPVIVTCSPTDANAAANLRCRSGTTVVDERSPANDAWELPLKVGDYDFDAEFAGHAPYRNASKPDESVYPPEQRINIEVWP